MPLCVCVCVCVQRADLEAGKKPDKVMGAQAHKRAVAALEKQIAVQQKKVEEVRVQPHWFPIYSN